MPASITFRAGDKMRVRRGVNDVEYSDIPLGGWAGIITEIEDGICTVKWTRETLASILPVFRTRCERDGSDFEVYCIEPDELEPDPGGPLEIEQPTRIITRPLSPSCQEERIAIVFNLTSDDLLPDVDEGTLHTYHKDLSKHFVFPFAAKCRVGYLRSRQGKVIGLVALGNEPVMDENGGLFCAASVKGDIVMLPVGELDEVEGKPNRQLIEDSCYWFHNW